MGENETVYPVGSLGRCIAEGYVSYLKKLSDELKGQNWENYQPRLGHGDDKVGMAYIPVPHNSSFDFLQQYDNNVRGDGIIRREGDGIIQHDEIIKWDYAGRKYTQDVYLVSKNERKYIVPLDIGGQLEILNTCELGADHCLEELEAFVKTINDVAAKEGHKFEAFIFHNGGTAHDCHELVNMITRKARVEKHKDECHDGANIFLDARAYGQNYLLKIIKDEQFKEWTRRNRNAPLIVAQQQEFGYGDAAPLQRTGTPLIINSSRSRTFTIQPYAVRLPDKQEKTCIIVTPERPKHGNWDLYLDALKNYFVSTEFKDACCAANNLRVFVRISYGSAEEFAQTLIDEQ